MEFKAKTENALALGGPILALVQAFSQPEVALKVLAKHGLEDVRPDGYYPHQNYLDAIKEIEKLIGNLMLTRLGTKIVDNAQLVKAPDIFTFFDKITDSYRMNHKNDMISYYKIIEKGNNLIRIETNNPYPSSFDIGLFIGFMKLYFQDVNATVESEDSDKRVFKLTWK